MRWNSETQAALWAHVTCCQVSSAWARGAIVGSGQPVTAGTEEIVKGALSAEETLGLAGGFEPAPLPLALPGRLMGEFGAVVQPLVWAVLDAWDQLLVSGRVALELIGDDDPGDVAQALKELGL